MNKLLYIAILAVLATGCTGSKSSKGTDSVSTEPTESNTTIVTTTTTQPAATKHTTVEIVDTCNLRIYYPDYSRIDLVCGKMPEKEDESVIMFAEAAFTGELLDRF